MIKYSSQNKEFTIKDTRSSQVGLHYGDIGPIRCSPSNVLNVMTLNANSAMEATDKRTEMLGPIHAPQSHVHKIVRELGC